MDFFISLQKCTKTQIAIYTLYRMIHIHSIIQTLTGGRFSTPRHSYKNVSVLRLKLLKIKHVEKYTITCR
jgi:hypothetical protein